MYNVGKVDRKAGGFQAYKIHDILSAGFYLIKSYAIFSIYIFC